MTVEFSPRYQVWLDQFVAWASPRPDIRAAIIFGSQAKKGGSYADDWSDIDVAFFTSRPGLYTQNSAWMREIAPMWSGVVDTNEIWDGVAAASGFSVYEGGLIIDTVVLPVFRAQAALAFIAMFKGYSGLWKQTGNPIVRFCNESTGFFRRGAIVLFDKDGLTRKLAASAESIPHYGLSLPSLRQFQRNTDSFWVDPPRVATNLRRGKLAGAMRPFNLMLKQLYTMAEWHARAKNDREGLQHYPIKTIEKWADPFVVAALAEIYPRYDAEAIWSALMALAALYRRLTAETAALLGYDYDVASVESTCAWLEACYAQRG